MRVPIVAGNHALDQRFEVSLRARARLDQREPRGGVRQEHVQEPIAARLARERLDLRRDIDDAPALRDDVELRRPHGQATEPSTSASVWTSSTNASNPSVQEYVGQRSVTMPSDGR